MIELTKEELHKLSEWIKELNESVGLKESTFSEVNEAIKQKLLKLNEDENISDKLGLKYFQDEKYNDYFEKCSFSAY